jgi:hypothetical protein
LIQKIKNTSEKNGFIVPNGYFQRVEKDILNKVKYPNHHTATLGSALWKIASIIVLMFLFYYNEQSMVNQNEFAEFYIEDYLTFNTTYEIADHSDYSFENSNFSNSYESVSIGDTIELRLYGESPTNLNLFDDE